MASMEQIRQAIADKLTPVVEASGGGVASPWMIDQPTPPVLHVIGPETVDYLTGGFGDEGGTYTMLVQGVAGAVSDIQAQDTLDLWLASSGTTSVREALEEDQTLNGTAFGVAVDRTTRYQFIELQPGVRLLVCEWTVRVET